VDLSAFAVSEEPMDALKSSTACPPDTPVGEASINAIIVVSPI
jgi:hypothetical protein